MSSLSNEKFTQLKPDFQEKIRIRISYLPSAEFILNVVEWDQGRLRSGWPKKFFFGRFFLTFV